LIAWREMSERVLNKSKSKLVTEESYLSDSLISHILPETI